MEKKYELTGKTMFFGQNNRLLHRIRCVRDIDHYAKAGTLGGWVESEKNLSQEGNCWIYEDAKVMDNAVVSENAKIYGETEIGGNTQIYGDAMVDGKGQVRIFGEDIKIHGKAELSLEEGSAISDSIEIADYVDINGYVNFYGRNKLKGHSRVYGHVGLNGVSMSGYASIYGNISNKKVSIDNSELFDSVDVFAGIIENSTLRNAAKVKNGVVKNSVLSHSVLIQYEEFIDGAILESQRDILHIINPLGKEISGHSNLTFFRNKEGGISVCRDRDVLPKREKQSAEDAKPLLSFEQFVERAQGIAELEAVAEFVKVYFKM